MLGNPSTGIFSFGVVFLILTSLIRGDAIRSDSSRTHMLPHVSPPKPSNNKNNSRSNHAYKSTLSEDIHPSWDSKESFYIWQNLVNWDYFASQSMIDSPQVPVGFSAITVSTPIPNSQHPSELDLSIKFESLLEFPQEIGMKVAVMKPEPMSVTYLQLEEVIQTESHNSAAYSWRLDIPSASFSRDSSQSQRENNQLRSGSRFFKETYGYKTTRNTLSRQKEFDRGVTMTGFSLKFIQQSMGSDFNQDRLTITIEITQYSDYFDLTLLCSGLNSRKDCSITVTHFLQAVSIDFIEFARIQFPHKQQQPQTLSAAGVSRNALQTPKLRQLQGVATIVENLCPDTCTLCGAESSICVNCKPQHFLHNQACTLIQPDGTYCETQLYQCYVCGPPNRNCKYCDMSSNCISCYSPNDIITNGSCTSSGASSCPVTCATCTSNTSCQSCQPNKFLFNSMCYDAQPSQTYCTNNSCVSCNGSCETCTGPGPSECETCHETSHFLYGGQCVEQPPSTYCVNKECWDCPINCTGCSSATVCTSCAANFYLYNDNCTLSPPTNTLCTLTPLACVTCDPTCGTCSGSITHCDSCFAPNQYFYNNACTPNQPGGTNCDTNKYCVSSGCADCVSCSGTTCYACIPDYYLYNGNCSASQPSATYCWANLACESCPVGCASCMNQNSCQTCNPGFIISNGVCVSTGSCHADCANCQGTASTDCLTCSNSSKFLFNHICYDAKPAHTYCDGSKACLACKTGCDTCTDGDSCATCISPYYFYQNLCQLSEPNHAYCDGSKICVECFNTCATCESNLFNGCLSCSSAYPYLINKECKDVQPSPAFCNANNECTDCPTGCSLCTDGSHCQACIANYYLYQDLCYTPQPPQTFCNNNRECQSCHNDCATCDGSSNSDCLSCANTSKYLYQKQCHSSPPSGAICNSNNICTGCPIGCVTCSNATTCQTCNSNYYFYNSQCTSIQPSKTYCDSSRICNDCHADCATCSAANSDSACLTCQNTSKFQFSGQCVTTPNPDTFCDANKVCTQCSNVCATCSNSTSCDACAANYYFFQNQCTINKPSGTICNTQLMCSACHQDCADCTVANSSSSCTACANPNKYLFQNSCFPSQPPKTYCDMDRVCSDCPSLCETCTSDTICQTCVPGNYLYLNFCYVSQPLHTFCDNSKVCNDCYADCEKCIAANSSSSCLTCQSGKFFYNSSCFATQPTGTGCAVQGAQLFSTCAKCPVQCATCDGNLVCLTCSVNFPDFVNNDCVKYPDCQKPCATCELGTASTCSTCPTGFILKADSNGKSTCMCEKKSQTLSEDGTTCKDKETGMSEATTESMKSALDNASVATSGLAVVFAASSVFTGSGTAMLSQAFTLQKIFYLQLMNLEVPSFLKMFLQSIDGFGILKKYRMFNIFSLFMDSSGSDLDYMYKDMEVRGGVFSNAGGALSVEIVLGLVQALFVILIGQSKESIAFKAYSMVFCGMMLQMLPLLAFAIVDTISIELILIPNLAGNYEIGVLSLLLLVCLINAVAIFVFLGRIYFRTPVIENVPLLDLSIEKSVACYVKVKQIQSSPQLKQQEISKQSLNDVQQQSGIVIKEIELQLRRDTIAEKFPSRTYMFFYNIVECVLFPLVSVLARDNFILSMVTLGSLQLLELCYTLKIRPFFNKITNLSFILEQSILFMAYVSYLTLGLMLNALEQDESSKELPQSIIVGSFLVAAFSLLAIIVNPIIQIMLIYQNLKAARAERAKSKFVGKFTNFDLSVFATVELARKQNIEFPLAKQDPCSIDE